MAAQNPGFVLAPADSCTICTGEYFKELLQQMLLPVSCPDVSCPGFLASVGLSGSAIPPPEAASWAQDSSRSTEEDKANWAP